MFKLIVDTREKKPFDFIGIHNRTISRKLDTGDYSIEGYEDKITIDRKATSAELAICLGSAKVRFYKELERMRSFDEAYIVCAFPLSHIHCFPTHSGIPRKFQRRVRIKPAFLLKSIREIEEEYGVEFIFCEDRDMAEYETYSILKNYYENNQRR